MKKFTLIAAASLVAVAAQAQYSVNPSTSVVIDGGVSSVSYITLSDAAIADFQKAGAKVQFIGPDPNEGRNLWYWEETFVPGDESMPRVDEEEGGYISVVVTNKNWSGAGLAIDNGLDLTSFDENTRFHMAYMTPSGNGPASIAIILLNKTETKSMPAEFAIGNSFDDNGTIIPTIAPAITDEWQGIDISFADLKRVWPAFDLQNKASWEGNLFSWLGGGVTGQEMAFDAIYFYNTGNGGVINVAADETEFVVSGETINVMGTNGIVLYNLNGQVVKSTNGAALGINNVPAGVYVAKAGNKTHKVVVR